jgi:hypothetical protein
MIKTLVKLLIVALVLNALYRVGTAYWTHYQFEDSVQQLAQFADRATPEELRAKVLEQAGTFEVPLDPENLAVTRGNRRVEVDATYFRDLELVPRYKRHWDFKIHVIVLTLN